MPKISFSHTPMPKAKKILEINTDEIGILDHSLDCIETLGVGPCIVFIAYYEKRPLGLYHWSGPLIDSSMSVQFCVESAINRLKYKILESAWLLDLPDFSEDSDENSDETEPFDILPLGGQDCSQNMIDAVVQVEKEKSFRIITTKYLNLSIDNDFVNIALKSDGDILIEYEGEGKNFKHAINRLNRETHTVFDSFDGFAPYAGLQKLDSRKRKLKPDENLNSEQHKRKKTCSPLKQKG